MSTQGTAESYIELRGDLSKPDAITGKSAYEIALLHGFEGTEEEWLESLKADFSDEDLEKIVDEVVDEVEAKMNPVGTASSAVSAHDSSTSAHADIREQISQLSSKIVTDEHINDLIDAKLAQIPNGEEAEEYDGTVVIE